MALDYNQLSATTHKHFVKKLVDNVFDSDPWLQRMKKKDGYKKLSGGSSVVLPLSYARTSAAGWYSGADTLSTTDNEQITAAEYQWKQFYVNISISRDEELKNSGPEQIIDMVKSKTKIAEDTLIDYLGDGLYSAGTDPKSIVGTRVLLATSGTIGGIPATDYSWWRAQVDSSTTTLTMAAMQTVFNNCSINNKTPTVGLATRANYNRYYALLQPQQRFVDGDTAKGGFQNLMFNGIPIIVGSKVPTGHLIFANESHLNLFVHKDEDMRFRPFQEPVNQNVKTAKIFWMGAFGSDNLRMSGALTALTA
jgi:hypothetical protein